MADFREENAKIELLSVLQSTYSCRKREHCSTKGVREANDTVWKEILRPAAF